LSRRGHDAGDEHEPEYVGHYSGIGLQADHEKEHRGEEVPDGDGESFGVAGSTEGRSDQKRGDGLAHADRQPSAGDDSTDTEQEELGRVRGEQPPQHTRAIVRRSEQYHQKEDRLGDRERDRRRERPTTPRTPGPSGCLR